MDVASRAQPNVCAEVMKVNYTEHDETSEY